MSSMINQTLTPYIQRPNPSITSEFPQGQHFLCRKNTPLTCEMRVIRTQEFMKNRNKSIDIAIRETALVNSTLASAILQLSQMNNNAASLTHHITIYNSLQECLSTSIVSLEQIKENLTAYGKYNLMADSIPNTYYQNLM